MYRRLIRRAGVITSTSANIICFDGAEALASEEEITHDDVDLDVSCLDLVDTNVVSYLAGWIIRKLLSKLKCADCHSSLLNNITMDRSTAFIATKTMGGLIYPSVGIVKVCQATETAIRAYPATTFINIQHQVLNTISDSLTTYFPDPHFTDSSIESHLPSLFRLVMHMYYKLKQFHRTKVFNAQRTSVSIRSKAGKAIHFRGD